MEDVDLNSRNVKNSFWKNMPSAFQSFLFEEITGNVLLTEVKK